MAASAIVLQPKPLESFKFSATHQSEMLRESPIQVFVATYGQQSSSMVPLEVSKWETIASVKIRIQAHRRFVIDQHRLVFDGKELNQDEKMLKDYGVNHGDVLHLVLRLSDLVSLTIKTADGGCFLYKVMQKENLKGLKAIAIDGGGYGEAKFDVATLMGENVGENPYIIEELVLRGEPVICFRVHSPTIRSKSLGRTEVELVVSSRKDSSSNRRMSRSTSFPDLISKLDKNLHKSSFDLAGNALLQKELQPIVLAEKSLPFPSYPEVSSQNHHGFISSLNHRQLAASQFKKPSSNIHHELSLLPSPSKLQLPKHPISFDLSPHISNLLKHCRMGLKTGHPPILTSEGSGGVYLMRSQCGMQNVAVFKPVDEEPFAVNNPRGFFDRSSINYREPGSSKEMDLYEEGLKKGTKSGEGALREVAAYILDHPMERVRRAQTRRDLRNRESEGFSGVPPTLMVECYHDAFNYSSIEDRNRFKMKAGSLQQFVHAISSCEDMGASMFPVDEVHKISILDLRLANTDRNGGNILVCKGVDGALKLVPIDHGYCFPEKFEDCTFEWLYWPQAQKPYGRLAMEYIKALDAGKDIALLQDCGWDLDPKLARVLHISTMLLKKGASAGLTPFQIGSIMSRIESPDVKSPIECIVQHAETIQVLNEEEFLDVVSHLLDEHIASLKSHQ